VYILTALASGVVFGFGLALSQMINPAKVLGFLDIAGDWDPSLAFVMAGAVAVTLVLFRYVLKRKAPLYGRRFFIPARRDIDARLIAGAALFGAGWGLVGFCPGPALAALVDLKLETVVFVAAMLVGGAALRIWIRASGGNHEGNIAR
tara:strand:- start:931 stop:1374 length:444 start_codon:yes stop_codon:yes gene_type:complete